MLKKIFNYLLLNTLYFLIFIVLLFFPFNKLTALNDNFHSQRLILRDYHILKLNVEQINYKENNFKTVVQQDNSDIKPSEESVIQNIINRQKKYKLRRVNKTVIPKFVDWDGNISPQNLLIKKSSYKVESNKQTNYNNPTLVGKNSDLLIDKPSSENKEKNELNVISHENTYSIKVSSLNPEQGSTLAVFIEAKVPIKILAASFNKINIKFFKIKNNVFRSLIGLDVQQRIGKEKLSIVILPKDLAPILFSYDINVKGRYDFTNSEWKKKMLEKVIEVRLSKRKRTLFYHKNRLREREFFKKLYLNYSDIQQWTGKFIFPIDNSKNRIISFGRFRKLSGGNKQILAYHRGIDISRPKGTEIHASNNGIVVVAGYYAIRGYSVVINHGQGVYSCYFHMAKIKTKKGHFIKKGEKLGEVGNTGLANGNHLHWEIRVSNFSVNPKQWCEELFNYEDATTLAKSSYQSVVLEEKNNFYLNLNRKLKNLKTLDKLD